jgi:oligopeptide transport system substrate-binding protein
MDEGLTSMDPAFSRNQNAIWAVNQIFNGLVQIDDSLITRPCIAKSWEADTAGTTYTFHLRNDVYFHDDAHFAGGKGRKVIAQILFIALSRLIDPKVASSGSWIFSDKVHGKQDFIAVER